MTDYSGIVPDEMIAIEKPARSRDQWQLHLEADGSAGLYLRTFYGGDGTPEAEWHRRRLVWSLCGQVIDVARLREDLSEGGELARLLDRVRAGHSVEWDGSNHVGWLTEDAAEASEALEELLGGHDDGYGYSDPDTALWDAGEWWSSSTPDEMIDVAGIGPDATDEEIRAGAERLEEQARADNVILWGTVAALEDALARIREDA